MGCLKLNIIEQRFHLEEGNQIPSKHPPQFRMGSNCKPITKKCVSTYTFGFNGQENDHEMKDTGNSLDFGARIYDPRIGRFLSVDPRTKEFSFMSPYVYASNTPVTFIDKDGEGIWQSIKRFANRSKNLITKGTFKTNYEITYDEMKTAHQAALEFARYNDAQNKDYADLNLFATYTPKSEMQLKMQAHAEAPDPDMAQGNIGMSTDDIFDKTEDWLDAPSSNGWESVGKIGANILYSIPNDAYTLLSGTTLAGSEKKIKTDAFVGTVENFVPLKGLKGAKINIAKFGKINKGVYKGVDHMARKVDDLKQINKVADELGKNVKKAYDATTATEEVVSETKNEIEK